MALICDSVFWQMIRAVKPRAETHVLDVLPHVWPAAHTFFEGAAASPAGVIDGSLRMALGIEAAPAPATPNGLVPFAGGGNASAVVLADGGDPSAVLPPLQYAAALGAYLSREQQAVLLAQQQQAALQAQLAHWVQVEQAAVAEQEAQAVEAAVGIEAVVVV